jgi:hypothetical protein
LRVNPLGLVLAVEVHMADIPDREGARSVLEKAQEGQPRWRRIWADGGDAGGWGRLSRRDIELSLLGGDRLAPSKEATLL